MNNIEEFLALAAPGRYDFSNDGASEAYNMLDGFQNTYEKFFIYMSESARSLAEYENGKAGVMAYGAKYKDECKSKFGMTPDPDSESNLLQLIYKKLWCDKNLEPCKKDDKKIQGETMNSANTTLGRLYEERIETLEQQNERNAIKAVKVQTQGISIAYIISRYAEEKSEQKQEYDKIRGLKCFLSVYHTLGNFIPVPKGCNGPRGIGPLKDYWDLTLKIIYEYYDCEKDEIMDDIVGKEPKCEKLHIEWLERKKLYKEWLDSFKDGDMAKGNWQCFVEKNYLQDFVNQNADGSYGMPKELWQGHFKGYDASGTALPDSIEQIEQFYCNASCFITARSTRMLECLNK